MIKVFGSLVGQEELDEIKSSFENQWLGIGPKVKGFEEEFAKRCGFKSFVMTDSGSNSLYLAIKSLNLKPGSEIILPSFTFVSCAQAVVENRCSPVFADVDYDTQNVTIATIAPLVTERTGAIMVVHYAGKPVNIKPILDLGIPIIEDCAHAVDTWLNGVHAGALGDIGVFSFDSMKNLSIGEGGGITASSSSLVEKVRTLRYCGIGQSGLESSKTKKDRWWETEVLYYSLRHMPSDVAASIGLAQLRKLNSLQAHRKTIWEIYQEELKNIQWIKRPINPDPNEIHSYFTYFIRVQYDRDGLASYLLENKIYSTLRYYPIHMMKLFKGTRSLINTERLNNEGLNLPLHPGLVPKDIEYIINTIKKYKPMAEKSLF